MYILTSINLTELGGPMGDENTSINFTKYFKKIENAKKFAQKDYNKDKKDKIYWKKDKEEDILTSGDLYFVEYNIEKIILQDKKKIIKKY